MERKEPSVRMDPSLYSFFRIGAAAAVIAVVFFRRNTAIELMSFNGFGLFSMPEEYPTTVQSWFEIMAASPYLGLVLANIMDAINYVLIGIYLSAVAVSLWPQNQSVSLLAMASAITGVNLHLASFRGFSLLSLSRQFAASAEGADRARLLAAGEALLAVNNPSRPSPGAGVALSLFFISLAGLLLAWQMRRSPPYRRSTAIVGLLANGIVMAHFPALLTNSALAAGLPIILSAPLRVLWYVMGARSLWELTSYSETTALSEVANPQESVHP